MFWDKFDICVIMNDIYIKEDVFILIWVEVLLEECILGVEMGGCLYMVIREDVLINLFVVFEMQKKFFDLDIILIELGGDNFVVMFSFEFVDFMIYVIDVVQGEKIFWKGGLGIMCFDMFVINKIDLVLYVGVLFEVMEVDIQCMCGEWLYFFINFKKGDGVVNVVVFIVDQGGLQY